MQIYKSTYKDIECVVVENAHLRLKIIPSQGAKVVSIVYLETGYEALIQNLESQFKYSEYGASFTEGEMSGWDEMFPSVSECRYFRNEYQGVSIPDHGEVWALNWDYEIDKDYIKLWVNGRGLPYTFTKVIALKENIIHTKYSAVNNGEKDLDFIWALHPLFKATEDMEILLPDMVNEVINVCDDDMVMRDFGRKYNWPDIVDIKGNKRDLSIVPKIDGTCMKFYTIGEHQGWCALKNLKDNMMIEITYPEQIVNYLGVWTDYMGYTPKPLYNVALEPCIGGYDSLEYAQKNNSCKTLLSNEQTDWYVDIALNKIN